MYGGIIRNCTETFVGYGGAVFVGTDAVFEMHGGTIENNKSTYGRRCLQYRYIQNDRRRYSK